MGDDKALLHVRDARLEDWPTVAQLLAELGRPDVFGKDDEQTAKSIFKSYLQRADTVALVAEDEDRVIGFCNMEYRVRLNFTTPQAWIPDLIVSERERSRGAGAMLLARVEELARAKGCWSMTLESANWRTRAHAFYVREGWSNFAKGFTRNLGEHPWPPPEPGTHPPSTES
jgi:GNAT superfamily N-acetyltransferase